tara:strand:+ start:85 stop:552 length:468 start_codon:yes stop_codon:yes gene_type:complete
MIDPFTALSIASSAVSQIKQLTQAGRDIHGSLSKFAGAVSDVNYASEKAKNPSIWKSLTGSAEAEAIEIFAAQKKMQEMKKDVEMLIQFNYGMDGLEDYKNTLRKVRAQRKKTEYRKQEIKDALIVWVVGSIVVVSGIAGLGLVLYLLGKQQGKW